MRPLRDQSGFAITELMVAMTMMLGVLGAVLTTFNILQRTSDRNQVVNQTQERTRTAIDQMARELRNLASPTPEQPEAVDKAEGYDLVFQSVDPEGPNEGDNAPNVRRVRYCLNAANPVNGQIVKQSQTWVTATAPPVPSTATCPDPAWGSQSVVATHVTNVMGGLDRPIWTFDSTELNQITSIRVTLFVDVTPDPRPTETSLTTKVHLRNQNRPPTAEFTATPLGGLHVLLNGSASEDPEGHALVYSWYDGAVKVGEGVTLDYISPLPGNRNLQLRTYDPAGLETVSEVKVVLID